MYNISIKLSNNGTTTKYNLKTDKKDVKAVLRELANSDKLDVNQLTSIYIQNHTK